MTEGQRLRFQHMVSRRSLAPLPTIEDVRILLAWVDQLERERAADLLHIAQLTQERDAAIHTCADLQMAHTPKGLSHGRNC